jgi:hypothetical protein
MNVERDVLEVAIEAGRAILIRANGDPARTLAYGVAAAVVAVGVGAAYGASKYGHRVLDWFAD